MYELTTSHLEVTNFSSMIMYSVALGLKEIFLNSKNFFTEEPYYLICRTDSVKFNISATLKN